jgi:hypothetical protein
MLIVILHSKILSFDNRFLVRCIEYSFVDENAKRIVKV